MGVLHHNFTIRPCTGEYESRILSIYYYKPLLIINNHLLSASVCAELGDRKQAIY